MVGGEQITEFIPDPGSRNRQDFKQMTAGKIKIKLHPENTRSDQSYHKLTWYLCQLEFNLLVSD